MQTQLVRNQNQFGDLESEWNELLFDSQADTIFLTWQWIVSWIEVQLSVPDFFVIALRDEDGRLVAIAPFYRTKYRLLGCKSVSILRVLGDTMSGAEYGNVIIRNGFEESVAGLLAQKIIEQRNEWDLIWMPNVAKWTESFSTLQQVLGHKNFLIRDRYRSFSSAILPTEADGFLQQASANRRQQIRRICRKVFADESIRVVQFNDSQALPACLDTLFDLHAKRWSTKNQPGAFDREALLIPFYRSFSPRAMEKGWLRIVILEEAGRAVAIQYGFCYKGTYMQLQEGFDPAHESGLGTALRKSSIDLLIGESVQEYDFLGGHTEHKRRWQAVERAGCDLLIGHGRALSRLIFQSGIWPTGRYLKHVG